jgi:hypothetical protein
MTRHHGPSAPSAGSKLYLFHDKAPWLDDGATPQGTTAARPDNGAAPQGSDDAASSKALATPRRGLLHGAARWRRDPTTVVAL